MNLRRIIVIRHAESQEDVDPNIKLKRLDEEISITENGAHQVKSVTNRVLEKVSDYRSVKIYSSPSNRVLETALMVKSGLEPLRTDLIVEPRIRSLDWGSVTASNIREIEEERYKIGVLNYQFPNGDNSPMFIRGIGQFINELLESGKDDGPEAVIIVTHGFALRIIAKFLLNLSAEDFRWIKNPTNCYVADFTVSTSGFVTIDTSLSKREPV